jgi:NadR type nicotinamide-nucleotide adenylyltransferase
VTKRIVVTGPECTGKTTLATKLAERLGAPWLAEEAREYATAVVRAGGKLGAADVDRIAKHHAVAEDKLLASHAPLIVLDTDLMSTVAYGRHYYGKSSEWLESEARARRGDLYLLCSPDIEWEPDGIRDRPTGRDAMLEHFRRVLTEFGARVADVWGVGPARLEAAVAAVSASGLAAATK